MGLLKDNYNEVLENVKRACDVAGRDVSEVKLIAVSKTKPVDMLKEVYDAGARDFGENKVQEIVAKEKEMPSDINWHMIGHLQTNKVKQVIDKACLIHSVDSYRLAQEISLQAKKRGIVAQILVEVNIAEEESKFGISKEDAKELVRQIAELDNIKINGLMTIAPYVVSAEENRLYFRQIKQLSVDIANENIDNVSMNELSMGMTGDYMVAIEEGATLVRVGTGIFGERNYNK